MRDRDFHGGQEKREYHFEKHIITTIVDWIVDSADTQVSWDEERILTIESLSRIEFVERSMRLGRSS